MKQLHLGCGKRNIPGFINVDIQEYPHIHYKADIKSLPMFEDNSIDLIYTSASFQYFDREEGEKALREWHRVLKKGGILRISTVDFDRLVEVYQKYNNNIDLIIGPMYGKIPLGDDCGYLYHKIVYNGKAFRELLEKSGFVDIKEYDWRQTIHKDYDDQSQAYVPHMDKEHGILIMQNMEARKP